MIAFTQFTAPATCSEIFAHLHNVTLVASFNGQGQWGLGMVVVVVLIYIVLPAAVGICSLYLAIVWWKNRK